MASNRIARGIVLVPCLLLGGTFLATAAWGEGAAADNKNLALVIGIVLVLAGLLSQWPFSEGLAPKRSDKFNDAP